MESILLNCNSIDLSNCTATYYCKIAHKKVAKDIPKNCLSFSPIFAKMFATNIITYLGIYIFILGLLRHSVEMTEFCSHVFLQKFREINVFTLFRVLD